MLTCQPATSDCQGAVATGVSPTVTWTFPSEVVGHSLVSEARCEILNVLNEYGPPRELMELTEPLNQIHDLVEKAVARAESNSILIVGQRGVGKTTIVRHAITSVMQQHGFFRIIHLNGLLQTSDRMALRAIAQQLDAPAQDVAALTDIDHEENDGASDALRSPKRTFAEALLHMLTVLQSGRRQSKAIVFVLDEFDLFTQHPKQTLLYTLFDAVQCHQLPMLVVGLTSRLDVVELLEKRVKSRFSHRQLTLSPPTQFKSYLALAKSTLQLSIDMTDPNMDRLHYRLAFNAQIERLCENAVFHQTLRQLYDLLRDVRTLYRALMLLVCDLTYESPMISGARFDLAMAEQLADCKLEMLKDVSLLELSLLMAMRSLVCQSILKFNFEMVYDEYRTFMSRSGAATGSGMRLYKKPVALKAFEHLLALEVLRPLEGTGSAQTFQEGSLAGGTTAAGHRLASSNSLKEYAMVQLLLDPIHVEELVDKYADCPPYIKAWATQ